MEDQAGAALCPLILELQEDQALRRARRRGKFAIKDCEALVSAPQTSKPDFRETEAAEVK